MCVTKVWGVLGVNPGFTHFGGVCPVLGSGSFSPTKHNTSDQKREKLYHQQRDIIIILYIYISIQGGGFIGGIWVKRGIMGYRPFIDSPLDRYIYMLDSMILWIWIYLFFFFLCIFFFFALARITRSKWGTWGREMCVTKVWGVLGGKPWFYRF
jgi:hypothetical protein